MIAYFWDSIPLVSPVTQAAYTVAFVSQHWLGIKADPKIQILLCVGLRIAANEIFRSCQQKSALALAFLKYSKTSFNSSQSGIVTNFSMHSQKTELIRGFCLSNISLHQGKVLLCGVENVIDLMDIFKYFCKKKAVKRRKIWQFQRDWALHQCFFCVKRLDSLQLCSCE